MTLLTNRHPGELRLRRTVLAVLLASPAAAGACGDGDSDTIPVAEWVAQFDVVCVDTAERLSAPGLSGAEWDRISGAAMLEMRAVPEPDEMAETASDLLDAIEESSERTERTDDEINALDGRVVTAATELGVSDECIGGVPGE